MKLAPFTAAAVAGSLALGLGGVALAGGADPSTDDAPSSAEATEDADFEAFDNCLREQGVDLPQLPDLPAGGDLTDEQLAEMDEAFENVEIPDEAWDACEQLLPEGDFGELDDEAFAEFDQCLTDAGIPVDDLEEAPEEGGESAAEPSDEEIAQFEAAFEQCEELLPDDAFLEGCDELDGEFDHDGDDSDEGESESGADEDDAA